jgi:hypothetical protein
MGLRGEDAILLKGDGMHKVGLLSKEELDGDAQSSIERLFTGSDRDHACDVAWNMTARGDLFRVMRAARLKGIGLVIDAIRLQVGAASLLPETINHVAMEGWVFKAGHGDGCEIIIFRRAVDVPELTGGMRMRRRLPDDPAEWFDA